MTPLFTAAFAHAVGDALRRSTRYREAARHWVGAVVLDAIDDASAVDAPASHAVFLDLAHGECHAARLATDADRAQARYVIAGPTARWLAVLEGVETPTSALMRGHLRLVKGFLPSLLPHMSAANALVEVAREVRATTSDITVSPAAPSPAPHTAPGASVVPTDTRDATARTAYRSLHAGMLTDDSPPARLWEKAKRLGTWNPADIDFAQDRVDWQALTPAEQDLLLRLASLFQGGEEAVVTDILPLVDVIAQEGRLDEQLYLTSFVWEEAKHVEGMYRFLSAVGAHDADLTRFHTPSYTRIFGEALPTAMQALRHDSSPVAQARASATYNMIVEGVLAETGYHVFHAVLTTRGILPGMQRMTGLLKLDESRHIAYGLYLLSRLTVAHGPPVWTAITDTMHTLLDPAIAIIAEAFAAYPADAVPFGLTPAPFVDYAMGQFTRRMQVLERAAQERRIDVDALT